MDEQKVYELAHRYFTLHLGCREAVKNVVIPRRRREIASIVQQITSDVAVSNEGTTKETLNSILIMGVGAKSFDEIANRVRLGIKKGVQGDSLDKSQTEIVKFALTSAKAYWDVVGPLRLNS